MEVLLDTYYVDCLECKEVEVERRDFGHVTAHCI
jgi:hypothetical protein